MKKSVALIATIIFLGCLQKPKPDNKILNLFKETHFAKDTIKFKTTPDGFEKSTVQTSNPIEDTLISKNLDSMLIEKLSFTGSPNAYYAGNKITIDDNTVGCIVFTEDSWLKKISMLLYDSQKSQFYDVQDIGQLYGGESGMMYNTAWIYKNAESTSIFNKETSVSMIPITDEKTGDIIDVKENKTEQNSLLKWDKSLKKFVNTAIKDSINFCQKFQE